MRVPYTIFLKALCPAIILPLFVFAGIFIFSNKVLAQEPCPPPALPQISTTYCSITPATVSLNNAGTWSGPGVSLVSGTYMFSSADAGVGTHTLVVTNTSGCTASMKVTVYQGPVLVVHNPDPVCSPQTVDLMQVLDPSSILPPGTIVQFIDPDGNLVSDPSAVSTGGTYTVFAFRYLPNGSSCPSINKQVQVVINKTPVISTGMTTSFCSNDNFAGSLFSNPTAVWTGPGVVNTGGTNYGFRPSSAGVGTHTLTAINTAGGCQATVQMTVYQAPVLVVHDPAPVCSPQTVDLSQTIDPSSIIPPGTIIQYINENGNQVTNPTAVSTGGNYLITAYRPLPNGQNCFIVNKQVSVIINQTPVIFNVGGPYCTTESAVGLGSSPSASWSGPGVAGSGGSFIFSPSTAGPGTHKLFAASFQGGCQSSTTVTVYQAPVLVINDPAPVCSPQTVNLTQTIDPSSILPPGTIIQYFDGNNNIVSNPSAVSVSGVYSIFANVPKPNGFGTCFSFTKQVNVFIGETPITTAIGPFCSDDDSTYSLSSNPAGTVWGGSGVLNNNNNYYFQPSSAGAGTHTLVATNLTGGCNANIQVKVNPKPVLVLKTPAAVCSPQTIDLTSLIDRTASTLPANTVFEYTSTTYLGSSPVLTPTAVGIYASFIPEVTYTIKAITPSGCTTEQSVVVSIYATPFIQPLSQTSFCSDENRVLLGTQSGTGPDMWIGQGVTTETVGGGGRNFYFDPSLAPSGTHTLTLINPDHPACFATTQVTINPKPVLVLKTPAAVCSPQTIDLTSLIDQTASSLPANTVFQYYQEQFGLFTPVSTPTAVGMLNSFTPDVTYKIRATTPSGCTTEKNVVVSIHMTPVLPQISQTSFCSNGNKVLLGTQSGFGPDMWTGQGVTGIPISNTKDFYFDPFLAPSGTHTLTLINPNHPACFVTMQMTVNPKPVLVLKTPAAVCSPQTIDLTSLIDRTASTLPANTVFEYTYSTFLGSGTVSTPTAVGIFASFVPEVTYTIKAITPSGCTTEQSVVVRIYATPFIQPLSQTSFCSNENRVLLGTQSGTGPDMWIGQGVTTETVGGGGRNFYFDPSLAPSGTHTLTLINPDHPACFATTQVTVLPLPTLGTCPSDITVNNDPGKCGAIVTYTVPSMSAGCGSSAITQTGPASGSLFPVGITTVTYTLKDVNGNILSSCSFKVTVKDTEKPLITCNSDQNLNNNTGKCGATYTGVPTTSDNCPNVSVTGVRSDGQSLSDLYPIGSTTITWTVTDASGNTASCIQKVNVTDNEKPVITCGSDIVRNSDASTCGAIIQISVPGATDNCGSPSVVGTRSDGKPMNAMFPIGTTTISWKATDASGNVFTCQQAVTINDQEPPVITCGLNIQTGTDPKTCKAIVVITPPNATDNCGIPGVTGTRSDGQPLSASFSKGVTTIVWKATDAAGNSSSCTQTITVSDTEKPSIAAPASVVLNAPLGSCTASNVVLGTPVTSDNCGVASVVNNAPSSFPAGVTTVIWTVTDVSGNNNTATQTVTVKDLQKPTISGTVEKKFCNGLNATYPIEPVIASDNCGTPSLSYVITGATTRSGTGADASGSFNAGTSFITWTATDASGNTATWQTKVIIGNAITLVIPDAYSCTLGAAANTVYLGYAPAASIKLKAEPTGGTGTFTYLWSNGATTQTITVSPVVTTAYTVTVKDAAGCSKTETKTVTVLDVRCGTGKVSICIKSGYPPSLQTICVNTSSVSYYLLFGGSLGACNTNPATVMLKGTIVSEKPEEVQKLSLRAFPNPSQGEFILDIKTLKNDNKPEIVIYNVMGKRLEIWTVTENQNLRIGAYFRPGIYFAELRQGDKKVSLKLVKQ